MFFWLHLLACDFSDSTSVSVRPYTDTPYQSSPTALPAPTTSTEPCGARVVVSEPADGEDQVYYRDVLTARVEGGDEATTMTLATYDGQDVPGFATLSEDLGVVTFAPAEPLQPSMLYTASVHHRCGVEAFTFETSAVGTALQSDISGRTYALDLANGNWRQPEGGAWWVLGLPPFDSLHFSVEAIEGQSISVFFAAIFYGGVLQYPCMPSPSFDAGYWEDPYMELTGDVEIDVYNTLEDIHLRDFSLSGAFGPEGSGMQGVTLRATFDTRYIGDDLEIGNTPEAACQGLVPYGVSCEPCEDGVLACLPIHVEDIPVYSMPAQISNLSEEDVYGHTLCDLQ